MAATTISSSPFEGFEKRLELHYFSSSSSSSPFGLRILPIPSLQQILSAVGCTVVSAAGNAHFDAYILSESSLFVYPYKIIIKTCGTTQLLNSLPFLLLHAARIGLHVSLCRYSRGPFSFPESQPFPHSSFPHEVRILDSQLPSRLSERKSFVMDESWHVYSAAAPDHTCGEASTVEVCMTDLSRGRARAFCRRRNVSFSGDEEGEVMTSATGIGDINAGAAAFGFAFEPCGYSMNGLDGECYSTVHVTPEEGFSYASFECVSDRWDRTAAEMVGRAVRVFGPGTASVSVTVPGGEREMVWEMVESAVGMECGSCHGVEFPGVGLVTYQTFAARQK